MKTKAAAIGFQISLIGDEVRPTHSKWTSSSPRSTVEFEPGFEKSIGNVDELRGHPE
jgi:hypothetical protein